MTHLPNLEYDEMFLDEHLKPTQRPPFLKDLSKEISTVCKQSSAKVQSFYVVDDTSLLNFNCETFSKYPALSSLLKFVNSKYQCSLNSCVVNCYNAGQSRKLPHADDESYIDQSQPICTFTIGATREVLFYETSAAGVSSDSKTNRGICLHYETHLSGSIQASGSAWSWTPYECIIQKGCQSTY